MSINVVDSSFQTTTQLNDIEPRLENGTHSNSRKASLINDTNKNGTLKSKLGPALQGPPATVRGFNDKWIMIQKNTFTNWVNEQLKNDNESVTELKKDFNDGVKLLKLINALQMPNTKVSRRYFKHPRNQHESLENITMAINAITDDGIKLVNIGNVDIMNGNLKLVLGLIWTLILRYQIGKTKIPPKKLLLAWIKSILPQVKLTNLTTDLNDGIVIAGIINYCNSDLLPDWQSWNKSNKLENCTIAMNTGFNELNVPLVVTPSNMSSPELDELSSITYLSYYMKEDSPGYKSTLNWIQSQMTDEQINNFSTDWNDGWLLSKMVHKLGATIPGYPNIDRTKKEQNCQRALDACKQLRIEIYVSAKELSDPDVESIGVMATIAQLKYAKPIKSANEKAKIYLTEPTNNIGMVGRPIEFNIEYMDTEVKNIKTSVKGPKSAPSVGTERVKQGLLKCHFVPGETGKHEINAICDNHVLESCPIVVNVKADTFKIQLIANEKYVVVNQPFELCINPMGAGKGQVEVNTKSPSNIEKSCNVEEKDSKYYVKINPTEVGDWTTQVFYDNEQVNGSPNLMSAFDPKLAEIIGLNRNQKFQLNKKISFQIDVSKVGSGKLNAQLINTKTRQSIVYELKESQQTGLFNFSFIPTDISVYKCTLLFNGKNIKEQKCIRIVMKNALNIMDKHVHLLHRSRLTDQKKKMIRNEQNQAADSCVIDSLADNFYMTFNQNEIVDSSKSFLSRKSLLSSKLQNRGSPIDFNIAVDTSNITVDVQKCKSVLVNQVASFFVDTKDNQGEIKVNITNPDGNHIPVKITNNSNQSNIWNIEFNPADSGEHYIDVFYANQLVNGSPFTIDAYDPSKIKIVPCLFGVVDKITKFEVDASQAGSGQLEISVENGFIPCNFTDQGNLKFIPAFTPRESGRLEVRVKFNSHEVPGSPFICNVVDINKVTLVNYEKNGGLLLFPVNKTTHLELTSNDLANNDINIKLTNPSGHQLTVTRSVTPQNTLKISFVPTEIGTHLLHVDVASVGIYGSPFEIKVYDSARILVSDVRGSDVNKPCELTIDASSAGEGQLEIAVNDGSIKNTVKQIKIGHYAVSFLPNKQDTYVIDVRFNQECVPGCPKKVFVKDVNSAKVTGVLMENVLVGISQSFQVDGIYNLADLSARIVAPSEQEFVPKIIQTSSTECRIEWQPYELGTYLVQVTYCDRLVKGTPFKVKTYDPKRVVVYNLKDGLAFKPNTFCVDAGQAGEGSLEIGISCNGHYIPNQVKPLGNSKFEVHFLPQEATVHYANISFNNDSVKGSPFAIKVFDTNLVTAQGKGLGLIPINLPTSFQVFSGNAGGGGQVRALVTGSKGENVSVKIYEQPNGDSVGEFVPLSIGQYRIEILYANQPVVGSPFFANAYDPQALEIVNMPKDLIAGSENFLEVNLSRVGNVDFDIKVVAPSGNVLPVTFEGQAYIKKIRLVPIELGAHRISLMLAGQQINGMPITLNAIDSRLPNARGDGLNHALEDRQASFCVESQGLQGNLDVKIEGPQQYTKNQIERQSDGSYLVKYTPVEVGQFKIFVKWNNRDVPGSPFLSYVVNPDKVRIVGGWQSILDFKNVLNLKLFEEKVINFETSEAGPGTLNASILSPNGTKLPLRLASQGQMYSLIFTALYEGEYKIYLSWDNYQIPNTPIIAKTTPQSDITKIEITGLGLSEAKINQESDFVIDGSRAGEMPGIPEIRLSGTRCDIDVRVLQLGHGIYRCSYVPQIPGAYLLNIKWNNIQIGESPYKVNVSMNSDPAKVVVSGEGIKSGVYGQEIKALIDTRRAGPGELTAHCMGPTKVAFCEFFDHKDGTFTLYVKPQEPGKHLLQVKYNDDHVPGSPYIIRIAGPPDAGKVKVLGPGICHGVLNKFKSRFICETKGAGAGQLTVRIRGPKGAFRVEMQRETQKERTILCKYDPIEAGEYQINVKWSNQHVPGSPFNVHVFGHEDELEQFLHKNPEEAYAFQQQQLQNQQLNI